MHSLPSESNPEMLKLEERLRSRREARAAKRSGTAGPIDPYIAAAAVLVDFDPVTLNPMGSPAPDQSPTLSLSPVSQVIVRNGQNRWALQNDIRVETLRSLAATNSLISALDANPQESSQAAQEIFAGMIQGKWSYAFLLTPDQLAAALQATRWLDGIVSGLPVESELMNRLSRARFLAPFEGLAGEGFVGREAELAKLNDFVGVQDLTSTQERGRSLLRGWLLSPKRGALVLYGIGGAGKSTLIAQFILIQEGARLAFNQFPIVYIDFDDSSRSLVRSETICLEAARQLAMQYPTITDLYRQMQSAWEAATEPEEEVTSAAIDQNTSNIAAFQISLQFWQTWFPQLITAINNSTSRGRPPFLFAFDTFEEVVTKNRLGVSQIFRLVELMQSMYPELRPIISGRALDRSFGDDLAKAFDRLEVKEFDTPAAAAYLLKLGVTDPNLANAVVKQVGCSPLSLKLAAQAIRRGESVDPKVGFAGLKTTSWLVFSANETVVQGQLYQRILKHISNPELRKLAHPGLVLRRLTPDLIDHVLAAPCKLTLPTEPESRAAAVQGLFDELRSELTLVESRTGNAVRLSNDVRRVMLSLIQSDRPLQVAQIHSAAADYYFQYGETPEDRAEEIYHRLKRGEDPGTVFSTRWIYDAGLYLEDAVAEFTPLVQLTIASYAGLKLPNEAALLTAATLEDWERLTERRVQEGLASNRSPAELLAILNERSERSETSPLYLLKAQVLLAAGNPQEASAELQRGVAALASGGDKRSLLTFFQALGGALGQAGRQAEAIDAWQQSLKLAQDLELPRLAFGAALQALTLAPGNVELEGTLRETLRQMTEQEWRESPQSVQTAIALLGNSMTPDLNELANQRLPTATPAWSDNLESR
jgi:cellulose synthase operon protein C